MKECLSIISETEVIDYTKEFFIDPASLPQKVSYFNDKSQVVYNFLFSHDKVTLIPEEHDKKLTIPRIIPVQSFRGIVAFSKEMPGKDRVIILALVYNNKSPLIPVYMSRNLRKVLINWRLWADKYKLPMFLLNKDNNMLSVCDHDPIQYLRWYRQSMQVYINFGKKIKKSVKLILNDKHVVA